MRPRVAVVVMGMVVLALATPAQGSFVTFESGQVRPLALSGDGEQLFAVNTPDNRLEVFNVDAGALTHAGSVPVGMEPVALAVRPDTSEVWVVNHLSDSISIVDGAAIPPRVIRTLLVGDEPRDIVFAGDDRAFITTAHRGQNTPFHESIETVLRDEGTGRADVWVFEAGNLGAAPGGVPLKVLTLFGDTPRALAVSPDGNTVYAGVFHSGNQTTAITEGAVCNGGAAAGSCGLDGVTVPGGLPGGQVPGGMPAPNQNFEGAAAPETGLILKFNNANGRWEDQAVPPRNWNNAVRFSLPDLDVFAIDASATPPVETASFAHVGTVLMNMVTNPVSGKVYVSNTDARNEVRFEGPGGGGSTVRGHLHEARITVIDGSSITPRHLNKHITELPQGYRTVPMAAGIADDSLATPVGMAVTSDGSTLYLAAFGSNKVGVFNTTQLENNTFTPDSASHIGVSGGGPSGLVLDEDNDRLYVFTRFDNSISVINTNTKMEIDHLPVYNPEPASVVNGRRFLYDARFTSSNGEASCSSCHIFGDFDSLGWDLGNPDDIVRSNPNPPAVVFFGDPVHPMKGPMTTQTLRGMANHGPMHWRGDRTGGFAEPNAEPDSGGFSEVLAFKAFNVAFEGLLGRDQGMISDEDMQAFTDFILQVTLPPNPIRDLNNVLTPDQQAGSDFFSGPVSDIIANCNGCHRLDPAQGFFGADARSSFEGESQEFKVPHLRNMYQKVGMFGMPDFPVFFSGSGVHTGPQVRGFGFLHDGSVDTLFRFHNANLFTFPGGDPQRRQIESFMFTFDSNLAPIVGQQITLTGANAATVDERIDLLLESAEDLFVVQGLPGARECDLIVKGVLKRGTKDEERGFVYRPNTNTFESDRAAEPPLNDAQLRALVDTASEVLTYTCAPPGSGTRMGIDRDEDGALDRDEIDAGSDPADPNDIPPPPACEAAPLMGCRTAGKSILSIKNKAGKEKLNWKWSKGEQAVDMNHLGDPTDDTAYALCIYIGTAVTEINVPPSSSNWAPTGTGFKHRDLGGAGDGVQQVLLRAGAPGKPKVLMKAKGSGLPLPTFSTSGLSPPVTVQVINSDGQCWEASYGSDAVITNDENQFKAKF